MSRKALLLLAGAFVCALAAGSAPAASPAKDKTKDDGPWSSSDFSALKWRGLGPALASGRVGDFAVDPRDKAHYYVAVCSGGVWETRNAGITFEPIFDGEGSYSIGCVTVAPSRPGTVWVGTGENNSQRSVSYGDGVYKSLDGGRTWQNMGLKRSLHIGKIIVHPTDPDIVYVAAMGPLWGPGRRPRRLQDDRRRQDLAAGAGHRREHGRGRPGDGPARPRRDVRRQLPAAPAYVDADQRRPRFRHPQDDRRRQDLDEADRRAALGRPGAHRSGAGRPGTRRGVRHRRGGRRQGRVLPLDRRRAQLGQARRLRGRQPPVLQRDRRRPGSDPTASTAWTRS